MLTPLSALLVALLALAPVASAAPRYYVKLAETEEAPGLKSGLVAQAKAVLEKELRKRPELVLDLPALPTDPAAIGQALAQRNLKGIKMFVRLVEVSKEIRPPEPGHRYRQLQGTVRASLYGVTLPGDLMALSGDGAATASTEIAKDPTELETRSLLQDALEDALSQAVGKALAKLSEAPAKPPKAKRRSRK